MVYTIYNDKTKGINKMTKYIIKHTADNGMTAVYEYIDMGLAMERFEKCVKAEEERAATGYFKAGTVTMSTKFEKK